MKRPLSASIAAACVLGFPPSTAFHEAHGSFPRRTDCRNRPDGENKRSPNTRLGNANAEDTFHNNDDDGYEERSLFATSLNLKTFQRRRDRLQLQTLQRQWRQPPNPLLEDSTEFVQALLQALHQTSPLDGGGALVLLQSSTDAWRQVLLKSIGAPLDSVNEQIAPTLQAALEREDNQFAILMQQEKKAVWHFPSDALDFQDGTSWVESRLRTSSKDELWVAAGWSLEQRPSDGAWLLDGVNWQDFREDFRPGIGREEWERICG